ncbi:FkbM family methyltransferase [Kaistella jeonii]|uniref:FkbM family methyltransferase n=1 Tax=Kaistella jeonii TaxID=266749 RepID=UPI00068CB7C1|nr:FkbM family methyltransferase [Kaistella jeonii]SFB80940.1 methyltransferase, FkbM family [Kaistella jeonii]VEI96177.1 2-O-methyltransferase NoeI [Kaistella jeonii]
MRKLINDLVSSNYHLLKNKFQEKIPHHKCGISEFDRNRILKPEFITNNSVQLFGKPFHYSSATALLHSLDELFLDEIYKFKSESESPYIIDCGANMGLSVLYFKHLYPNAEIDAFEPDKNICEILQKNVDTIFGDQSIRVHDKAIWTKETILEFFSDGGLSGSMVADFANTKVSNKIQTVDLKKYLNRTVDFLKIDIEGAENEVIFDLKSHLGTVKNLFLEYHGIKDTKQNLGDILNLLKEEGFEYYIRLAGETLRFPFLGEEPRVYNQQLNILCYRK